MHVSHTGACSRQLDQKFCFTVLFFKKSTHEQRNTRTAAVRLLSKQETRTLCTAGRPTFSPFLQYPHDFSKSKCRNNAHIHALMCSVQVRPTSGAAGVFFATGGDGGGIGRYRAEGRLGEARYTGVVLVPVGFAL